MCRVWRVLFVHTRFVVFRLTHFCCRTSLPPPPTSPATRQLVRDDVDRGMSPGKFAFLSSKTGLTGAPCYPAPRHAPALVQLVRELTNHQKCGGGWRTSATPYRTRSTQVARLPEIKKIWPYRQPADGLVVVSDQSKLRECRNGKHLRRHSGGGTGAATNLREYLIANVVKCLRLLNARRQVVHRLTTTNTGSNSTSNSSLLCVLTHCSTIYAEV